MSLFKFEMKLLVVFLKSFLLSLSSNFNNKDKGSYKSIVFVRYPFLAPFHRS